MRMGRAGGLLVDGTAEEHLRIGALEDAGDAGAPLELLLNSVIIIIIISSSVFGVSALQDAAVCCVLTSSF